MPTTVTIEGSITASTLLPRGQRRTVQLTERVQRLIDRGFVTVIERHDDDAEPDPTPEQEDGPPSRNASRPVWLAFLRGRGVDIPTNDEGAEPTRDGLVALWQQVSGGG
jgi:hypothetical protein